MSGNDRMPTERFSDRVENYIKYRPGYPSEIIPYLARTAGLGPSQVIADVGSGTGILSELFLRNGNRVYGIEPNTNMREAGKRLLAGYPHFTSVDGTAENTSLLTAGIDFVAAGQAFHWFEPKAARREFLRVLRPEGQVVLIWNDRKESDPLGDDYESLLKKFGIDYAQVSAKYRGDEEEVRAFFDGGELQTESFANSQTLDFPSLEGRLLSASYAPQPEHPNYPPMIAELRGIFGRHEKNGRVTIHYDTRVYSGRPGER